MSDDARKWWCNGCGAERDVSIESCPACGSFSIQSFQQPANATAAAANSNAVTITATSSTFPGIHQGNV